MEGIYTSPSKSFFAYCTAWLIGITGASLFDVSHVETLYLIAGLSVPAFFIVLFWKEKKTRCISLCMFFLILGVLRYTIAEPDIAQDISSSEPFVVTIVAEPDIRIDSIKYIVSIKEGPFEGERVYFSSGLYPRYEYGDVLSVACDLERPEAFEDFRYDMYLATRRVFLTCTRPSIERIQAAEDIDILRSLYVFKANVANQINELWPEPYASFMAGLLYGYRGGLGSLQEQFNITGVTHIVAISGYNITIVSTILLSLFISLRVPRQRAFWFVVVGIILFVLFVGASASVVRAGVMGIVVLVARQMGRISRIGNVLVLTAVLMTMSNPYILVWDAGFQLSFLATIGLVYIAPLFDPYVKRLTTAFGLRETVVATLAATIATLPLILYQFGRLSIVSPIVNVLVLPIIPFVMLVGFVSTVVSFVYYPIGQFIGFIAWGGMVYIVSIVRWFSKIPFAAVEVSIPFVGVVVAYGILGYIVVRKLRNKQNKD